MSKVELEWLVKMNCIEVSVVSAHKHRAVKRIIMSCIINMFKVIYNLIDAYMHSKKLQQCTTFNVYVCKNLGTPTAGEE